MVRVHLWTQLLLLVLIVRQSDAVSDHSGKIQEEISRLEADITKKTEQCEQNIGECKVSIYTYIHIYIYIYIYICIKPCRLELNKNNNNRYATQERTAGL